MKTKSRIMIKYFNIHNLVRIKVQTTINLKMQNILAHWREFEETPFDNKDADILICDYSKCPVFEQSIVLSNYYFYSKNYLNIPAEKFCFNIINVPFIIYCDTFRIPLNFLIELVLLKKGYSLIHAAAVKYGGKNYLFPAFGGVGKTTTIASMLFDKGQLFGDDMVIIKNQEILSYPMDFSVYPYHLNILRIKDAKIKHQFRKTRTLDNITNKLVNHNFKAIKLLLLILNSLKTPCFNVAPKKIFGENCIKERGEIDEIYYLCRIENGRLEITFEKIESNKLVEICANVLLQEWHGAMSILYTYSGLSLFSLDTLLNKIKDIFRQTVAHYNCHQINIPNSLDNPTYQKQLISHFDNKSS